MPVKFDKYDRYGALHWRQTNWLSRWFNSAVASRYNSVVRHLPAQRNSILDIGCGDGRLTYLIAAASPGAKVRGIDADYRGIAIAQQEARVRGRGDIVFAVNSDNHLPDADQTYDTVVMTDVIEHLPDPAELLKEICRVLTPNGAAIVTTPNRQEGSKWDQRHEYEFSGPELKALLLRNFDDVSVYGSWPMNTIRISGKKRLGRVLIDVAARLGYNVFDRESENPTKDWGQLTAVCRRPRIPTYHYQEVDKVFQP